MKREVEIFSIPQSLEIACLEAAWRAELNLPDQLASRDASIGP